MPGNIKGLKERLKNGETILIAEGYLFVFERRGYLQAGAFVPEVIIEHPELVKEQHREFVHAGSDVVLAFTYYAHRKKMQVIEKEAELERINREALRIAKEVADESGKLLAGNICNTGVYEPENQESYAKTKAIFKEQIEWALDYDVDFILAETFPTLGEAKLALEAIQEYGKGVPSVVTFITAGKNTIDGEVATLDGFTLPDACKQLEDAGADVVGMNCCRGPNTMLPIMEKVRAVCKGHLAAVPVPYRTTPSEPTFFNFVDPKDGKMCFPTNMDIKFCNRSDMVDFGKRCQEIGINFVGICCGNSAHLTRALAESYGRTPPASRYSAKMENHFIYGTNPCLVKYYNEQTQKLF
ncbi:betaine--homocysteine S-methyltransferase 1-like isoform X2 [Anneissia japonica]|uniref:betaine--homocysteine S-methyltransferase 1-like isoform X1 n=1 Tax=Anneissia japonica TaxID=1529436 RepID=UPI0014257A1B|nr:betaine--homocysteine S-methyltransferase 1-like isoform X1 [Anneissia japonica]XP_033106986.1 betaine--homocysteine S-methyltransferase 1-like isoform X2 [Anneissia japonica]